MRLEQNLEDANVLPDVLDISLQKCWGGWKNVLRPREGGKRDLGMKRSTVLRQLY